MISADDCDTVVDSIAVDRQTIHVIASAGDRQKYIRFDGQLKEGVYYFMSSDVSAGSTIVLSNIGSYPIIGHSTGIDAMASDRKFHSLLSSDYPVRAICPDNSSGFFYASQYQSGESYVNTIMHSLQDTHFTPVTISSASSNIKLLQDNKNPDTFAVMTNEAITLFTYKNNLTSRHDYTASELGGLPAGITAAEVSGYDGNSGSSGCNAMGMGMAILCITILMIRRD